MSQDNEKTIGVVTSATGSIANAKMTPFPIDLAQKVALVKPTDSKGATMQTQQTFRTITQPQMRVVIPGVMQTSGNAQIIQTHLMPQTMIKQVDSSGRTQITALPNRSMAQTSITVSRPPTTAYIPRATVTQMSVTRGGVPIRAQTPPVSTITNIATSFVRAGAAVPPRTPSPASATVLSPTSVQLIRANISQSPRSARVLSTQALSNVTASHTVQQSTAQPTYVSSIVPQGNVRQPQTATLVYSSVATHPQQQGQPFGTRITATGPRQVRPIQVSTRLPANTLNVRVTGTTSSNLNIRGQTMPVLPPSSILSGTSVSTVRATTPITGVNIPGTRIFQMATNNRNPSIMTIHPVVVNPGTANTTVTARAVPTTLNPKMQQSLTITTVGKLANANAAVAQLTQQQQQSHPSSTTATQISNATSQQIVSLNLLGQNTGTGGPVNATVVPLTITSRPTNVLTQNVVATTGGISNAQLVRSGNSSITVSSANVLPIAKVMPQQQHMHDSHTTVVSAASIQNMFVHTRAPTSGSNMTGTFYYDPAATSAATAVLSLATTSSSNPVTTVVSTSGGYVPQAGSFAAVVPSSSSAGLSSGNRTINQIGIVTTPQSIQTPVRFNPQLLVDSNSHQHQQIKLTENLSASVSSAQASAIQSQIIAMQTSGSTTGSTTMVIPVSTTNKIQQNTNPSPQRIATGSILRKTEIITPHSSSSTGSSMKAAKNLAPALLSMNNMPVTITSAPISIALSNQHMMTVEAKAQQMAKQQQQQQQQQVIKQSQPQMQQQQHQFQAQTSQAPQSPPSRPGSSNGSTTVSANSSPGLDQQQSGMPMDESHQLSLLDCINKLKQASHEQSVQVSSSSSQTKNNNGQDEAHPPRKNPRKREATQTQSNGAPSAMAGAVGGPVAASATAPGAGDSMLASNSVPSNSNKENAKPSEVVIKKPRSILMDGYRQNWKAANNHFQRYSDVKPREERRPTVMDLANQAHVGQKANGWRIYHLSSQMEDLCDIETQVCNDLGEMLGQLEVHSSQPGIERVNELIKANLQRSKIVADEVNNARLQTMRIFDHKSNVSDIINRCASKRNFKKREKS